MLHLRLLGTPEISLAGAPVAEALSSKAQAILFYLAVTGRPQPRTTLATLLWGDMPDTAARTNLRKALANLRRPLGDYLDTGRQAVAIKSDSTYWVDVAEFEANVSPPRTGESLAATDVKPLQDAVELYRGDFLSGFYVLHAPDFEAWLLAEQARLRELVVQALHTLAGHHAGQDELGEGIGYTRRLLNLEPWREEAHRQLMLLLVQDGQRSAALTQFETCRQVLAEELDVEPGRETVALYERIRAGSLSRGAGEPGSSPSRRLRTGAALPGGFAQEQRSRGAGEQGSGGEKITPAPPPPRSSAFQHNLPPQTTSFVGRAKALANIVRCLSDRDCRLLTLVGPGGAGKTRLAIESARQQAEPNPNLSEPAFLDGVYFVNLASLTLDSHIAGAELDRHLANGLATAIAEAVDFPFHGSTDLMAQLLTYLRDKTMLLILDNFEQLVAGAVLLPDILRKAPSLKLIVTSRERLNLQEEWVLPVDGLHYPDPDIISLYFDEITGLSDLEQYEAVALFIQQARQVQANLQFAEADIKHIGQICRLVEGIPLGLVLAAGWLPALSCAEIVTELERSLDFLETSLRNVPKRHRSLRAVFEHSWHMLLPQEQDIFSRLSIFRGGFQREAAQEVAAASLLALANLVNKSLLRRTDSGRYEMHELLRQYAQEKLQTIIERNPVSAQQLWQKYALYYLNFAAQQETGLRGNTPQAGVLEVRSELDNIRQAWQWARAQSQVEALTTAVGAVSRFYDLTGLFQEGEGLFDRTATAFQQASGAGDALVQALIVRLRVEQSRLLNRRGLFEQSNPIIAQAAELVKPLQNVPLEAMTYLQWGGTLSFQGDAQATEQRMSHALRLAEEANLPNIKAEALRYLGIVKRWQGNWSEALALFEQALAYFRQLGERRGESLVLNNLGIIYELTGDYVAAQAAYTQSLQIFRELEDRWGQGVVLNNLGLIFRLLGDYSQAQALFHQGLAISRAIQDRWGESHYLHSLGCASRELGDYTTAQHYLEESLKLRQEFESWLYVGHSLADLGLLHHLCGENAISRDYSQQAIEIAQENGSPPLQALASCYLGHAFVALGELQEAQNAYQQAWNLHHDLGEHSQALEAKAGLARVMLVWNKLEVAQTYLAEMLPHVEGHPLFGASQPFRVHLTCYRILQALRDPRALEVSALTHRLLQAQAAKIEDDTLRHSFLENITTHREIAREYR